MLYIRHSYVLLLAEVRRISVDLDLKFCCWLITAAQ